MQKSVIQSVDFGYFSPESAIGVAEVEITTTQVLDELKNALEGGLYDPALGLVPGDRRLRCQTCNQTEQRCVGHLGRIALALPVYNPFLLKDLLRLLRAVCFGCHRFAAPARVLADYQHCVQLLRCGLTAPFLTFEALLNSVPGATARKVAAVKRELLAELAGSRVTTASLAPDAFKQSRLVRLQKEFLQICAKMRKCPLCKLARATLALDSNGRISVTLEGQSRVLTALEAREHTAKLCETSASAVECLFGRWKVGENDELRAETADLRYFFIEQLLVTPTRFRPESKLRDQSFMHAHTLAYAKIVGLSNELRALLTKTRATHNEEGMPASDAPVRRRRRKNSLTGNSTEELLAAIARKWERLQEAVSVFLDSATAEREKDSGVRQLLEKKEGLFRMRMMGKRVNYAARSVISPDPYLRPHEVGLPLALARRLTYPEAVNALNVQFLRRCVLNGAFGYPGAVAIEEGGERILLEACNAEQRLAFARQLLVNCQNKRVHRYAVDGDLVFFNRQPTLHKSSFLAFRVRVLPQELTIRLHYVSCAGFNADFDGDEMNVHLPQNELARAEAALLLLSDRHFVLPTNRQPIRGLIQDFVCAGVFLTMQDAFFTREEYFLLLHAAIARDRLIADCPLRALQPAVLRPRQRWSGKQLLSNIVMLFAGQLHGSQSQHGLTLRTSTRTPKAAFGASGDAEAMFVMLDGYLCTGVADKNQIGSTAFGLLHSFFELYGHDRTGRLTFALTHVFLELLKLRAFTVGMADLLLTAEGEQRRAEAMAEIEHAGVAAQSKLLGEPSDLPSALGEYLARTSESAATLDLTVKEATGAAQSKAYEQLFHGLELQFPTNNFSMMVLTGAKGSSLNQGQVSINLGQQELEGRRVPLMASGKSLPCFAPFDPRPRCGGYVQDRFLTGLRTPELFFHCMAGREGLIDTAVKTSRSGYLQRTLMKNLEGLVVGYDFSVRDIADGSIIQFAYGEDGLDPTRVNALENVEFLAANATHFAGQFDVKIHGSELSRLKAIGLAAPPTARLAAERAGASTAFDAMHIHALVSPGESVGAVAAQSFGEPSTQMTLNTFHLAGHGGLNVTLGIPRLRELLCSKSIKDSFVLLPFRAGVSLADARAFHRRQTGALLAQLLSKATCRVELLFLRDGFLLAAELRARLYKVVLQFEDFEKIERAFGIGVAELNEQLEARLLPRLETAIGRAVRGRIGKTAESQKTNFIRQHRFVGTKYLLLVATSLTIPELPLLDIIDDCCQAVCISKGILPNDCRFAESKTGYSLQLFGQNYTAAHSFGAVLDLVRLSSNDPHSFALNYGIEAARRLLIAEIRQVFAHYGIKIDIRHIMLVADYMCFEGEIRTLSRSGIQSITAPFLKMSYETTCKFLIDACNRGESDCLRTPSSRIVAGREMLNGTGFFEIIETAI